MPTAVAIVLSDAAGTPVNHTFNPSGKDSNEVYWYVDRSQANAIGYWKISVELKEPNPAQAGQSSAGRTYRVRVGLHEPVLETLGTSTVSGIPASPTIAYIPRAFAEFLLPERSILLDRQHLRKMMASLLANAQIVAVVENLERVTG